MFVAEAANVNPEDFSWLVFIQGSMRFTGNHNQQHKLVLKEGDLFGIRRTRSNTYNIIKADALHVLFRSVTDDQHKRLMKRTRVFRGKTPTKDLESGYKRHKKLAAKAPAIKVDKRKDDYFRPANTRQINEKVEIDLANYQWRKAKTEKPIKIVTRKQGKSKHVLNNGDLIGARHVTPARGGYIIIEGDTRINIGHELYTEIVHASRILPANQQREGLIDLTTGKKRISTKASRAEAEQKQKVIRRARRKHVKEVPEYAPEEPIEQLFDFDHLEDSEVARNLERRGRLAGRISHQVKKMLQVPGQDTWVEDGEDAAFEPEEETDEQIEEEDVELENDLADDSEDREDNVDDEDLEDEAEPLVEVLEPGDLIKLKKGRGREFVLVQFEEMERNANLIEYMLHDPDSDEDDFVVHRLRLGVKTTLAEFKQNAEVVGTYDGKLETIQNQIEYATFKPISFLK